MRPLPLRARLLIYAVTAAGGAVLALQLPEVPGWTWIDLLACAGFAGAVSLAAWRLPIPLPQRTETETFSMVDAVWAAGLLLVRPSVLLFAAAVGVAIGQTLRGVDRYKVLFNVGQDLVGIGLALAVYGTLGASPEHPGGWLAAGAAMATYFVVNATIVSLVIAIAGRKPFLEVLLPPLRLDFLQWAVNVALGILVAVVWFSEPAAVPLLVVPLLLSYLAYRGWIQTLREHFRMNELATTADSISEQGDLTKRLAAGQGQEGVDSLAATLNGMLDRLEASYRRERRFISEASHELRTPITICRGHLEVMSLDPRPDEVRETTGVILDELDRMGRLLGDLTTLARAEEPQFVRPEPVAVERFLPELATKAAPLLNGRLHIGPLSPGAIVEADPQRLTQALINLLHNAAVHTAPGSPVDLRLVPDNGCWRFEVADVGGGLPPGQEELLFAPFSRGSTSAAGSGLGLAIVRRIAEAHGGSAGAENRPGEGATFWFKVPR